MNRGVYCGDGQAHGWEVIYKSRDDSEEEPSPKSPPQHGWKLHPWSSLHDLMHLPRNLHYWENWGRSLVNLVSGGSRDLWVLFNSLVLFHFLIKSLGASSRRKCFNSEEIATQHTSAHDNIHTITISSGQENCTPEAKPKLSSTAQQPLRRLPVPVLFLMAVCFDSEWWRIILALSAWLSAHLSWSNRCTQAIDTD